MANKKQLSFAGGELAPALHARTDQLKYTTGAKTMLNTFVLRHGGTANRPGTNFVSPTALGAARKSRLIPFVFNRDQSYALEFGHYYIKVVKNGTYITDTSKNISNIESTTGAPYIVTVSAHGYTTDDQVYIEGVVGIESLNGKYYTITVLDVNRFELNDTSGAGSGSPMIHEDITDSSWIEVDTGSKMVVSAGPPSQADLTTDRHLPIVCLYKDFGVDYFDQSYIIDWTARINSIFSYGYIGFPKLHNLTGGSGDAWDIYQTGSQEGGGWFSDGTPGLHARISVRHSAVGFQMKTYGVALNTNYFMRMERDENASTYGDVIWSIYPSDADRTNDTNVIYTETHTITAAQGKMDFRYMTATSGWADQPGHWSATGRISDIRHTNNPGDPGGEDVYVSGGTAERVYSFATGYPEADLFELHYTQSADVLTVMHPHHPTKDITRLADDDWTVNTVTIAAQIGAPTGLASDSSGTTFYYKVTAVDAETNEESLPTSEVGSTSETSTLSWTAVTGAGQYNIYKKLNGVFGFVGVAGADASPSFKCDSYTADTTDTPPEDRQPFAMGDTVAITGITQADPCVITVGASHGFLSGDHVWIQDIVGMTELNDFLYYVTSVTTTEILIEDVHTNVAVDSTAYTAWSSGGTVQVANNFPATGAYYQQRMVYGFMRSNTEGIWASKTGLRKNMMVSTPIQDDDAITFSIVGRQVNAVKHLLDVGDLVVFTASGEWKISGGAEGVFTPTSINPQQQTANGCSELAPLVVDGNAIYVQARGSIVRDLGYEFESNGYKGSELSIFAAHLFDNYTLVDWAYQQTPHSIVWAVRSDGVLLGMTYIREHEINAWHQHTFGDEVESVCVIPEGNDDVLYMVVKRTIQASTVRYIEKMTQRQITNIEDMIFMDSALSYDGRHTGSTTMILSGGTLWLYDEDLTLTASAAAFLSTDVGNQVWLTDNGITLRCTIQSYTSDTIVTVRPHMTVPSNMQGGVLSTWAMAVDELSGLSHLEGRQVSVLADGFVVANPNNPEYDVQTVTDGAITLEKPYTVIHVGLPYISDLETLNMDNAEGASLADKRKNVSSVTVMLEDSRGGWVGPNASSLNEFKQRNTEGYSDPVALRSGAEEIDIQPEWNSNGGILIRQTDPLPLSVLAVIPSGYLAK